MYERCCRHQTVYRRRPPLRVQPPPGVGDLDCYRQDPLSVRSGQAGEPALEYGRALRVSTTQSLDPAPNLTDNEHTDIRINPGMSAPPGDHLRMRLRFLKFGQDVRVNQKRHD